MIEITLYRFISSLKPLRRHDLIALRCPTRSRTTMDLIKSALLNRNIVKLYVLRLFPSDIIF